VKRLIVNADDFGRTHGINSGVLEAHLSGIVTSATAMVLEPAAEEGIEEALRRAPGLALGLHFAVTGGGLPASEPDWIRGLLVDGRFARTPDRLPAEIPEDDIRRELEAQILLFEKLAGRPPSHLDSHHHSALHPSIQPVYMEVARSRRLPARSSSAEARAALRSAGVKTTDFFLDGFYGDGATAENLHATLASLEDGTSELMCHPGRADAELLAGSTYARLRERELEFLCSPEIAQLLAREKVEQIDFRDL
jgi:chitin disaccharide deacetylase